MNYYPHHIGDFNSATRHLSRIERSVYRDLIDLYYDTELPLCLDTDRLCRLIIARTEEEVKAVTQVLSEFFTKEEIGFTHERCDQEITKYLSKAKQAAENGKRGGRPRKPEQTAQQPENNPEETQPVISGLPEDSGSKANQEPITNNQIDQDQKICAAAAAPVQAEDSKANSTPDQPKASKGTRLAKDWTLPEAWRTWALDARADLGAPGIELEADKFRDHWHAATGSKATKADWLATWRNWVRNANAPRNVHAFPVKSAFTNIPQVNAAEIRARTAENERLGVRRANF